MNSSIIQKRKNFIIFKTVDGVILCNETIEGFAHTHLKNVKTANRLIDLSLEKKLPHDIPRYLLISLIRINSDERYISKANELLENKKKKDKYINKRKIK